MAKQGNGSRMAGGGCLILFALPFAAVGVGATGMLFWSEWEHRQVQRWQETPCRIREVRLENGGESREVKARYEYTFAGRDYTGTRVGLHSGRDNIGSFQQRAYGELERRRREGKPFRCYVNPEQPSQAILYRQLRWEMMLFTTVFAVAFGGAGLGLLAGGLWLAGQQSGLRRAWAENPREPWLAHPPWAAGEIRSSGNRPAGLLAAALIVAVLSVPATLAAWDEYRRSHELLPMLSLVFPAISLLLAVAGLRALVRRLKYGVSVFRMAEVPGVIGGKLAGVVMTNRVEAPQGYLVRLSCIKTSTVTSGGKSQTSDETVWEDERAIARDLLQVDPEQTAIPVLFAIPWDVPGSAPREGGEGVAWRLEASAATPGVDYRATFEVPVFKTPESRADFQLDERPIADYSAPRDADDELRRAGVVRIAEAEGDRYVFGAGRNLGSTMAMAAFALLWSGMVPVLIALGTPLFFSIVWGAFALLLVMAVLQIGFYRSEALVSAAGIRVDWSLLVWRGTRWIEASSVEKITSQQAMKSGSHAYYEVAALLGGGKRAVLGRNIAGSARAAAVARRMEQSLRG